MTREIKKYVSTFKGYFSKETVEYLNKHDYRKDLGYLVDRETTLAYKQIEVGKTFMVEIMIYNRRGIAENAVYTRIGSTTDMYHTYEANTVIRDWNSAMKILRKELKKLEKKGIIKEYEC